MCKCCFDKRECGFSLMGRERSCSRGILMVVAVYARALVILLYKMSYFL